MQPRVCEREPAPQQREVAVAHEQSGNDGRVCEGEPAPRQREVAVAHEQSGNDGRAGLSAREAQQ